ncbi:MAG: hypothetical protein ACK5AZ_11675 [Bryobacteraceae bacterium]
MRRTAVTEFPGGSRLALTDPGVRRIEWNLEYANLSDIELQVLSSFFETVEGSLREFTFLDPLGNLLRSSESLVAGAWTIDPMIQVEHNVADPLGAQRASRLTNTGQVIQAVTQTVAAPASYQLCFSLWLRSGADGSSHLLRAAADGSKRVPIATAPEWKRVADSGRLNSSSEEVRFGLELAPGDTVDVFGFQVEPQLTPSRYRKTTARSGVYPNARFLDDVLRIVTTGPDEHHCRLRLTAREE